MNRKSKVGCATGSAALSVLTVLTLASVAFALMVFVFGWKGDVPNWLRWLLTIVLVVTLPVELRSWYRMYFERCYRRFR